VIDRDYPDPVNQRDYLIQRDYGKVKVKFEVLHGPMDYATGCWFVPDIHNRRGQYSQKEGLMRRRVSAIDSARAAG
jgi:hypothetical protein